ncbi:hypothetical protein AUC43_12945 [Hymenobacter sedentarius]|uniref:Outer membrane protein beta-barrel domain-containing protein n=1 Tax=Hymenobacter sedentarius TaxID=1411621 RepID=A0A0U3SZF2_9BACT|nr:hypothetical protein [Hymenobacter sedentarius]ALW85923.1 hypothetical protein AUC43_12945 [Hymenobacter sedentarius]
MKHPLLLAAFGGCILSAHGQVPGHKTAPRPYEVGLDVVSYVSLPLESDARSQLHGPAGLFFRYTPPHYFSGRAGLRASAGFSQRVTGPIPSCRDCPEGETTARALTLRAGAHYVPFRKLPWFYGFVDGTYRNSVVSGDYTGGLCGCLDYTQTRTGQGWGTQAGMGATIALFSRFAVVPELYYEDVFTRTTDLYEDHAHGSTFSRLYRRKSSTPAFRVLATVSF